MNFRSLVITLLLLITQLFAHAHTIWIEASNKGQIGKEQQVKIFFGEYSDGKPTKTAKWFSDLKDYKLMMTAPDGKVTELNKNQDSAFYFANFTPDQEGVYTFWLDHEVKDVFKDMKITYTAGTYVSVKGKQQAIVGKGRYQVMLPNAQKSNAIIVLKDGKPYAGATVNLEQVGNKDGIPVQTDKDGKLLLPKGLNGNYLLELSTPTKVDNGMHNGKEYKTHYLNYTYLLEL